MLKKKNTLPLMSGAFAMWVLSGGSVLSQSVNSPDSAPGHWTNSTGYLQQGKEVRSLRDAFSKHFEMPDGSMEAVISAGPVHYQDALGRWQDIDPRPVPLSNGVFAYENTTNLIHSFYPANILDASGIKVISGSGEVRMGIDPVLEAMDQQGNFIAVIENAAAAPVHIAGRTVSYDQIFPNASCEFEIGNGKVKNNLVLGSLPSNIPSGAAFLAFTETLVLPAGWMLMAGDRAVNGTMVTAGEIAVLKDEENVAFNIPMPDVYELNDPAETIHPDGLWEKTYCIRSLGQGVYKISTLVPIDWLIDQNRTYPVVIDPTIMLPGNWGGQMHSGGNAAEGNPFAYVTVSDNVFGNEYRGYIQWDVSSVPDISTVQSVELRMYLNQSGNGTVSDTVRVNAISGALGPYNFYNATAFADFGDGYYAPLPCSLAGENYGFITLGSTAASDLQATLANDIFELGFSQSSNGYAYKIFTSDSAMLRIQYSCANQVSVTATAATNTFGYEIDCYGEATGSVTTTVAGGSTYTYLWSGPNGYQDTLPNPGGLAAGTYVVTVYSSGVCYGTDTVVLEQPDELVIHTDSISTYFSGDNITCTGSNDGSIDISVTGSSGYTYSWAGPNGFSATTEDISGLYSGTYYVTATEGNNSCTVVDSFILIEPALALVSTIINVQDAYCANDSNGSAQAGATGGTAPYTYLWNNTGAQTTDTVTHLNANTNYTVTVTDANGCTSAVDVFIGAEQELPIVNLGPADTGYCEGGFVLLNAGAGFASYLWSDASTGQVLPAGALGIYIVTVTDFNGCSNSDQISVSEVYPLPTPDLGPDVIVQEVNIPYILNAGIYNAYFWNTGVSTQIISVSVTSTYSVTVTDEHGCQNSDAINISVWPTGIGFADGEGVFELYPVPAHDVITLTAPSVTDPSLHLTVTNAVGQTVTTRAIRGGGAVNEQLQVSHLPAGLYFIRLTGETTSWQRSFTVK